MITDYTSRKNEVIASYEQFQKLIDNLVTVLNEADLPDFTNKWSKSLNEAKDKVENIREDRFRLMIAGEAKSGKSTFINAYLGVELLPMDVKQCTSSIIEVKYGEQLKLIATYADETKKEFNEEVTIRGFLKENAALDDDWRDIPVPTINQEILVKAGRKFPKVGKKAMVPKEWIEDLLKAPEVQAANIHNIANYNEKIRSYIESRKNGWRNIVTKIEIYYPLSEELKGIEIIDSPGVCARGGVSEITSDYIEKANAIIFLKPISGQALESLQFNEFLKTSSLDRNREALFLVLTRATNVTSSDLKRLEEEAYKQFGTGMLQKHNILIVDSKAELYVNEFADEENISERIRELNKTGTLDEFVKGTWLDYMGDKEGFLEGLREKSRFRYMNEVLSTFGRKAHYLALSELLVLMNKLYNRVIGDLQVHINMLHQKAEDPIELNKKIVSIINQLGDIEKKMHIGVDEVVEGYIGSDGSIKKKVDIAMQEFKREIENIDSSSEEAFEELKYYSFQKIDEFKLLQKKLQNEIVPKCNQLLIKVSDASDIPYTSFEPDFSSEVFDEIKAETEKESVETVSIEEGITFKKTKTYSIYSQHVHFENISYSIVSRLEKIANILILKLRSFVQNVGARYKFELEKNFAEKKTELRAIEEAKLNSERIHKVIVELETLRTIFSSAVSENNQLNGGIKRYD